MSEAMIVQGTALQIKEYRGKRVVTFKDIDTVHKRPEGTARRNFNQNRQRFISGVDFFKVCADEIRTHKIAEISPKSHEPLTLITETGYLILVKSFTDDLAWKVQRELVDSYFQVRMEQVEENVDDDTPTETVIATDKLIKCAEIMAGCLESNRPYVLNILKHIVPNIEEQKKFTTSIVTDDAVTEVSDVTEKVTVVKRDKVPKTGYKEDFNYKLFDDYLFDNYISTSDLARNILCNTDQIRCWRRGVHNPCTIYRERICEYLSLPNGYFDGKPRRKRRTSR